MGDLLTEAEREIILDHWRKTRHPEEHARFVRLEDDSAILERTSRLLTSYQLTCANQAIIAGDAMPSNRHSAPRPVPINRATSPNLEQRAAHMTKVLAAQGG